MFSRIKRLFGNDDTQGPGAHAHRLALYAKELGEPEHSFVDDEAERIDIHAFGRDFVPEGMPGSDEGYVLLTNGMSDRRMTMPADSTDEDMPARAELLWYVREPTPEIVAHLRWLAKLPFIDETWLGFGHRIPMPTPPLTGCGFKTFLLLTPILGPDERTAEALSIDGDKVEILTVNLISEAEYQFIKQEGLDDFLDLLDENDYPFIFDPTRESYL